MELRVGNKYRLGRKIGSGSFGDIYLGKSTDFLFFLVIVNKRYSGYFFVLLGSQWSFVFQEQIFRLARKSL